MTNGDKALLHEILPQFPNLSKLSVTGTKLTDDDSHRGGFGAPTVNPLKRFQRDTGASPEAPRTKWVLPPRQCVLQATMFNLPAITCLHLELNGKLFDHQFCGDRHPGFEDTGPELLFACNDLGVCFPGLTEVSLYSRGPDSFTGETETRFRNVLRSISDLPRLEKLKLSSEWPRYWEVVPVVNFTRVLKDMHFSALKELTLVDYRTTPQCLKELLEGLLSSKLRKLCLEGLYMEYDLDSDLDWHEHEVDNSAKVLPPNRSIWELFAQLSAPLFIRKGLALEASGLMGLTERKPRQGRIESPRFLRQKIQSHNKEGHTKWERAMVEYITQSAHDSTILMPLWEDYHKNLRNGYEQRGRCGW